MDIEEKIKRIEEFSMRYREMGTKIFSGEWGGKYPLIDTWVW